MLWLEIRSTHRGQSLENNASISREARHFEDHGARWESDVGAGLPGKSPRAVNSVDTCRAADDVA